MYNLSDEEFDHLCRNAAENPEAELPDDGWQRLKRRLDLEMPGEGEQKRRWPFWIPFLLFLPFALYYWLAPPGVFLAIRDASLAGIIEQSPQRPAPGSDTTIRAGIFTPDEISAGANPGTTIGNKGSTSGQVYVDVRKKSFGQRPSPPLHSGFLRNIRERKGQTPVSPQKIHAGMDLDQDQLDKTAVPSPLHSSLPTTATLDKSWQGQEVPGNRAVTTGGDKNEADKTAPGKETITPEPKNAGLSIAETSIQPPATDSAIAQMPAVDQKRTQSLGFTLVAGPDWSNVSFASSDKTGFLAGILADYRFHRRWTVQTGLLYSRKHYTAWGDDAGGYPGYDPTNPNLKMGKVQANCYMWDIPVNIRYDLLAKKKHLVYAAMGVSSYLMNKEDLHFYYTYNNDPRYKAWTNENQTMYWFSAANLMAGYQYDLSGTISFRVEPFLKLPLRTVGYGNIQINSLGVLFGLTYSPFQRNSSSLKK